MIQYQSPTRVGVLSEVPVIPGAVPVPSRFLAEANLTGPAEELMLGSRIAAPGRPVIVIAEIGVNHDGSVERAIQLVDAARRCGADGIKLQVFRATQLMSSESVLAQYQVGRTDAASPVEMLRKYELSEADLKRVLDHARSLGLLAIATPFSPQDVATCARLELDAIKIASPDVVNFPLLTASARTGLPLIVSTGAATVSEVDEARRLLTLEGAKHMLLHCVSAYPAPDDQAHLCFIPELVRRFGPLVGYSDHAGSMLSGALAVSAGAILLERHLTYDNFAQGPDHAASSNPSDFAKYVKLVREATRLRGAGPKRVLPGEQDVRTVSRQSLVLVRDVAAGETLTEKHLTVQRPGTGIPASQFRQALGRRTTQPLPAGTLLTWDMIAAL